MRNKYDCKICGVSLDDGEILDVLRRQPFYADKSFSYILNAAFGYGWHPTQRMHFTREVIMQSFDKPQYIMCPECGGREPLEAKGI